MRTTKFNTRVVGALLVFLMATPLSAAALEYCSDLSYFGDYGAMSFAVTTDDDADTAVVEIIAGYAKGWRFEGSWDGESGVGSGSVMSKIDSIALTLAGVLALQAFIAYWRIRWFAFAGESGLADIRRDTYSKLVRMPMYYFSEHRVGELSSRIAADLTLIRDTLIMTVPQIIRQSVMLVGGLVFIFISSWKLTLVMLACIPVVVIFISLFGRGIRRMSRDAQDEMAGSNVIVEETLQGISSVKSFSNEAFETRRYSKKLGLFVDLTLGEAKARALFVSFIIFFIFFA